MCPAHAPSEWGRQAEETVTHPQIYIYIHTYVVCAYSGREKACKTTTTTTMLCVGILHIALHACMLAQLTLVCSFNHVTGDRTKLTAKAAKNSHARTQKSTTTFRQSRLFCFGMESGPSQALDRFANNHCLSYSSTELSRQVVPDCQTYFSSLANEVWKEKSRHFFFHTRTHTHYKTQEAK